MADEEKRAFDVTPTPESVELDGNGEGEVSFTVTSRMGRVRARVSVEAQAPAEEGWFEVQGEEERTLDTTDSFVVKVKVPDTAEPGDYQFRLRAISEVNPDEHFTDSAWVGFTVGPRDEEKPFPWWIIAVIAGVLVVGGLVAWLVLRDSGVRVPEVVDRPLTEARDLIEGAGLVVGDVTPQESDAPVDTVLSQDPEAGEKVEEGSAVDLAVAVEAQVMVPVPGLRGRLLAAAQALIEDRGLVVGEVTRERSAEPPGTVVDQSPDEGTEVPEGSKVDLVLAARVLVELPDLVVVVSARDSYQVGQDIRGTITAKVTNRGGSNARGTETGSTNGYMVDFVLSRDRSVPVRFANVPSPYNFRDGMLLKGGRASRTQDLGAGASREYSGPADPMPGATPANAFICAIVDPNNVVAEANEDNNTNCVPFRLGSAGPPDLVVRVSARSSYRIGEDIRGTITATVTNRGGGTARGTETSSANGYIVDFVLSRDTSVPVSFASVPAPYNFRDGMLLRGGRASRTQDLGAGASRRYSGPGGPMPGGTPNNAFICAVVDPGRKVAEANETNNTHCVRFQLTP